MRHMPLAGKIAVLEPTDPPRPPVQKPKQAPSAVDFKKPASRLWGAWAEEMDSEFGLLEANGIFLLRIPSVQ